MSDHHHSHQTDNPTDKVSPQRTAALKAELENLSGVIDTGAVRYWLQKAIAATIKFERNYFLRRKAGAEKQARLEVNREYLKERERQINATKAKFNATAAPTVEMDNKYPRGAVLRWNVDEAFDDYQVAVRKAGRGASGWRALATRNDTAKNGEAVVPVEHMTWGDDSPPYELCIMASMPGGTKLSNIVLYDGVDKPVKEDNVDVNIPAVDWDLIAEVEERAAEVQHGAQHVERWQSVLVALGVNVETEVDAISANDAKVNASRYSSPLWPRIASHLATVEHLSIAKRSAIVYIDAAIEELEEKEDLGRLAWVIRARNSVLGTAKEPFTADEAQKFAMDAVDEGERNMWTKVAKAL